MSSHVTPPRSSRHSQVGLGSADEVGKFALVLALHVLEGNDGSRLLVHNSTETSFAFDDDVGNAHLAAQSRQEDNQLYRVNIMANDDQGSLLGFDEGDDVVQAVFDEQGLGRLLCSHITNKFTT